jgi:hypothetical protein
VERLPAQQASGVQWPLRLQLRQVRQKMRHPLQRAPLPADELQKPRWQQELSSRQQQHLQQGAADGQQHWRQQIPSQLMQQQVMRT